MLRLLLDNKTDELHYSDDCLEFKVKHFYWIDILRKEREYELHIKIHDCLEEYIEFTEMVDTSRIVDIKDEFEKIQSIIDDIEE